MKQFWYKAPAIAEAPGRGETRVALLNLQGGSPLVLLGSGAVIWDLIDGSKTQADLFHELSALFPGVEPQAMEEHLGNFLGELSRHRLAVAKPAPAASRDAT
ncbi:PqqD family protein [Paenarthrobacter ilicis]|uniref:PqqD family protein n=1 Tax=Paenarthrobacter ilicis TaxID=43665 RepID=UPI00300B0F14